MSKKPLSDGAKNLVRRIAKDMRENPEKYKHISVLEFKAVVFEDPSLLPEGSDYQTVLEQHRNGVTYSGMRGEEKAFKIRHSFANRISQRANEWS